MDLAAEVIAYVLFALAALLVWANGVICVRWLLWKKRASSIPLFGGILAFVACLLHPSIHWSWGLLAIVVAEAYWLPSGIIALARFIHRRVRDRMRRWRGTVPVRGPQADDWRRQGQEDYLKGVRLEYASYDPPDPDGDHDHCEFCWGKFSLSDGDFQKGYTTEDRYRWICEGCFADFAEEMAWVTDSRPRGPSTTKADSDRVRDSAESEAVGDVDGPEAHRR